MKTSVFSLFIFLTVTVTVHARYDLIGISCEGTPDPYLCESSLRPDPRSNGADTEGLVLIMVDVVRYEFLDSLSYVNELSGKETRPEIVRALKVCARLYKVVLEANVVMAISAVFLGDPKFGEEAMIDSGNEAKACERQFTGMFRSPMSERTRYLIGISSVAAALVRILE